MVAIGRTLMTKEILFLDEATEGFAPLVRAEIWRCPRWPQRPRPGESW
jgi:branched-chain amino acid transport system ATP-binding protein